MSAVARSTTKPTTHLNLIEDLEQLKKSLETMESIPNSADELSAALDIFKKQTASIEKIKKIIHSAHYMLATIEPWQARLSKSYSAAKEFSDSSRIGPLSLQIEERIKSLQENPNEENTKEASSLITRVQKISKDQHLSKEHADQLKQLEISLFNQLHEPEIRTLQQHGQEKILELQNTNLSPKKFDEIEAILSKINKVKSQTLLSEENRTNLSKLQVDLFQGFRQKARASYGDLTQVPEDLLEHIFCYLSIHDTLSLSQTCIGLEKKISSRMDLWMPLLKRDFPDHDPNAALNIKKNYLYARLLNNIQNKRYVLKKLSIFPEEIKATKINKMQIINNMVYFNDFKGTIYCYNPQKKQSKIIKKTVSGVFGNYNDKIIFADELKKFASALVYKDNFFFIGFKNGMIKAGNVEKNKYLENGLKFNSSILDLKIWGDFLIAFTLNNTIEFIPYKDWKKPSFNLSCRTKSSITAIAASDKFLYLGYKRGFIAIYSIEQPYTRIAILQGHKSSISALEVVDNLLISVSSTNEIKIWNLEKRSCLTSFDGLKDVRNIQLHKNQLFYSTNSSLHVIDYQ